MSPVESNIKMHKLHNEELLNAGSSSDITTVIM
jgi:hypothetical protein